MRAYTLSRYSPLNTSISDENGKPLYLITTPLAQFYRGATTVVKYDENVEARNTKPHKLPLFAKDENNVHEGMHKVAQIRWHFWGSSQLLYNSEVHDINTFMPGENFVRE